MSTSDQALLKNLLASPIYDSDIGRITFFFDKRKSPSRFNSLINDTIWIISIAVGVFVLISLMYLLNIALSNAITTFSIILAILFPVYIERIQRPSLRIYAATLEKTLYGFESFWAIKVLVDHPVLGSNWKSLFARSWLEKRTAVNCRAHIKIFSNEQKPALIPDLPARWSGAIQPSQADAVIVFGNAQGTIHRFIDTIDLTPGDNNGIDIVIQYEGDRLCYSWNNETYILPSPRMARLRLEPQTYIIEVSILYGDRTLSEHFMLINSGDARELKLLKQDKRKPLRIV